MNVTNEWGANYYVLVGTKQLNSINAFTTAPYSNGGNVVFWIALNSQKQWGDVATGTLTVSFPIAFSSAAYFCTGVEYGSGSIANNTFAPKTVSKTQVEFSNAGRAKKYIVAGK